MSRCLFICSGMCLSEFNQRSNIRIQNIKSFINSGEISMNQIRLYNGSLHNRLSHTLRSTSLDFAKIFCELSDAQCNCTCSTNGCASCNFCIVRHSSNGSNCISIFIGSSLFFKIEIESEIITKCIVIS